MLNKICHMTSVHNRNDIRIFTKECRSLVAAGYDVTLLCLDDLEPEVADGVKIIALNLKTTSRLDRIYKVRKVMYKEALNIDADVYHFHDPELLPVGIMLKRHGKKVIYDAHEDVPRDILDKDWIPKFLRGIIGTCFEIYEDYAAKKFDAVITVSPHIVERFEKLNHNTQLVPNFPIISTDNYKTSNREPDNAICFAGGISAQWMHENTIKALEGTNSTKYLLAGPGDAEYLQKLSQLKGWANVEYMGVVPHKEVSLIYNQAVAGVALNGYLANVGYRIGSLGNTKLFEYMLAGLPVICTDYILWNKIVEGNNCGICINPYDIEAITWAINYLVSNPEIAGEMGKNGQRAVETEYNWRVAEKNLLSIYQSLLT